jgi:hypothetical protein
MGEAMTRVISIDQELKDLMDRAVELEDEWEALRLSLKESVSGENWNATTAYRDCEAKLRSVKTQIANIVIEFYQG